MQPSRRAFLLGRRPRQSSWAAFCERLSLAVAAPLRDLDPAGGARAASGQQFAMVQPAPLGDGGER
ncbi:hypothetical protein WLU71_18910, partial [Bordetella bronchiseptica]